MNGSRRPDFGASSFHVEAIQNECILEGDLTKSFVASARSSMAGTHVGPEDQERIPG